MSRPIRCVTAVLAIATVCALIGSTALVKAEAATPAASSRWRACEKRLDNVRTRVAKSQRTVTIVNQTSRTHARVSFWVRTDSRCSFSRKFLTRSARLGYGGTVQGSKRRQGSGTTPLGTYTMTQAFGNGAKPSTRMKYHRVRAGDYWVGDNASRHYNSLRNKSQGGFRYWLGTSHRNGSEYLPSYRKQYRYAVVINFNRAPDKKKAYRGTGIFLHVKGSGATAGCVSVSKAQMRTVLAFLKPGDRITISK